MRNYFFNISTPQCHLKPLVSGATLFLTFSSSGAWNAFGGSPIFGVRDVNGVDFRHVVPESILIRIQQFPTRFLERLYIIPKKKDFPYESKIHAKNDKNSNDLIINSSSSSLTQLKVMESGSLMTKV